MSPETHPLENPPAGEDFIIDDIVQMTLDKFYKEYTPEKKALRDAHPKSHGLVKALFTVDANIPADLQVGVFAKPRSFQSWIRFSNGSPRVASDKLADVRGIAIKLMVDDEANADAHLVQQDFLLANNATMFVKDAFDYRDLTNAGNTGNIFRFLVSTTPPRLRLPEFGRLANAVLKMIPSVLNIRYWSQTPYLLGNIAVKYSVRPLEYAEQPPKAEGDNYLREVLRTQLREGDVLMEFLIQRQGNPTRFPVEDPTIEWNEKEQPFVKVATIKILQQEFDTPIRDRISENMSFSPWHCLAEHRPLGGLNRIRKRIYTAISETRHRKNGESVYLPKASDWDDPAI